MSLNEYHIFFVLSSSTYDMLFIFLVVSPGFMSQVDTQVHSERKFHKPQNTAFIYLGIYGV